MAGQFVRKLLASCCEQRRHVVDAPVGLKAVLLFGTGNSLKGILVHFAEERMLVPNWGLDTVHGGERDPA